MVNNIDYKGIDFPVFKLNYRKIERKYHICIHVFCYENDLVYPFNVIKQKIEDYVILLLINDENTSHYVYIKDFNRFMPDETK